MQIRSLCGDTISGPLNVFEQLYLKRTVTDTSGKPMSSKTKQGAVGSRPKTMSASEALNAHRL